MNQYQLIKPNAAVVFGKPFFDGADAKQTATKNESGGATFSDPPLDSTATDRIAGNKTFDVNHWLYVHTPHYVTFFEASTIKGMIRKTVALAEKANKALESH